MSHMPCGIGELTMLQSLPTNRLSELKSLNNLRGELSIVNLENVSDAMVDPKEANLWGKQYIQSLELTWGPSEGQSGENAELVMEGLQPHSNQKQLCVNNYGGGRFPSWMMNGGLSRMLPNLTTVDLRACSRCQTLPCFVQLPHLRSLKLYGLEMVEHMEECSLEGPFFQSLQELSLLDMTKLKELWRLSMELPAQPPSSFPCLTQLMIASCGDLAYLELPPSPFLSLLTIQFCDKLGSLELHSSPLLSKLYISGCPKLTFLLLPPSPHLLRLEMDCCDELGSFQLHSSPLLSEVKISFCPKLTSLQRSPSPCFSQSDSYKCDDLASLEVSSFPCLKTLELAEVGEEVLRQLMPSTTASSLESISISSIDELMYLPDELHQHGSTLETLTIEGCSRLAMLPNWIGNLTSLTLLKIGYCPQLTSLPDEMCSLTTLETLLVFDCPYLSERCQREEGEDWPKIAHVPLIFIDGERV